ncbi:MAG TPA: condensation domain-containing protein, partial [Blastocatellia bacterium]|nr:condensation domain-containing protein [Blastocatellia bacterium]
MRTLEDLMFNLSSLNVKLWAEDGRLLYKSPKGVLTSELKAELAERKSDVIAFLNAAASPLEPNHPKLTRLNRVGVVPLSFAQERIWFLEQLEPDSPAYNIPAILNFKGKVCIEAVGQTMAEITRRHEALRTTFSTSSEGLTQTIALPSSMPLPVVDLLGLSQSERDSQSKRIAEEEGGRTFDLCRGPLARARVVKTAADSHALLLTLHHIVSDGWSVGVLNRELGIIYGDFRRGAVDSLPDLSIQYADFAAWQRRWLSGPTLERQLAYWKEQLAGSPALLSLPTDRPRPPVQSYSAERETFDLDAELSARLKAVADQARATTFMTLLSAFAVLLSRYSGQDDLTIGTPI